MGWGTPDNGPGAGATKPAREITLPGAIIPMPVQDAVEHAVDDDVRWRAQEPL
jgi:hypothetical protein